VSAARRYDDPCGVARALDVIGERWSMLVVRELLLGAKRFGQLRRGLLGVSPNVLSQRLRDLEDAGVVRRSVLAPPANVAVYELTPRGQALEPILIELGRWGSQEPLTSSQELTVDGLLLALKTMFVPSFSARYGVRVDGEWYLVSAGVSTLVVTRGRADAVTTLDTSVAGLRAFAFGRSTLACLEAAGELVVTGNRTFARRFPRLFRLSAAR
jgi:DNA-binding HxlR family transcriptional regulator